MSVLHVLFNGLRPEDLAAPLEVAISDATRLLLLLAAVEWLQFHNWTIHA